MLWRLPSQLGQPLTVVDVSIPIGSAIWSLSPRLLRGSALVGVALPVCLCVCVCLCVLVRACVGFGLGDGRSTVGLNGGPHPVSNGGAGFARRGVSCLVETSGVSSTLPRGSGCGCAYARRSGSPLLLCRIARGTFRCERALYRLTARLQTPLLRRRN